MVASFPGFARPKTALPPETERGLTSVLPIRGDYLPENDQAFQHRRSPFPDAPYFRNGYGCFPRPLAGNQNNRITDSLIKLTIPIATRIGGGGLGPSL